MNDCYKIPKLEKYKEDQIEKISKRIYEQKKDAFVSNAITIRMIPIALLSFFISYLVVEKIEMEGNRAIAIIVLTAVLVVIASFIYKKMRGKLIGLEADSKIANISKTKEGIRKYATKEERQRIEIIEERINKLKKEEKDKSIIIETNLKLPNYR